MQETLQAGVRDYNAGRYQVAQGEFQDVVHYYPLDDMAGTAQFYLGEIAYQQKDYATAINDYNCVLEGFSGNAKAPAAELHKGFALLELRQAAGGHHELRELIQPAPADTGGARGAQQAERDGREDCAGALGGQLLAISFRFQLLALAIRMVSRASKP